MHFGDIVLIVLTAAVVLLVLTLNDTKSKVRECYARTVLAEQFVPECEKLFGIIE